MNAFHCLILICVQDENEPSLVEKLKASVCYIANLFALKYEEVFPQLPEFINVAWVMITSCGASAKFDEV